MNLKDKLPIRIQDKLPKTYTIKKTWRIDWEYPVMRFFKKIFKPKDDKYDRF